jgi:hypothetical protein
MLLDTTNKSIQILLDGSVTSTQLPVTVSYVDNNNTGATEGSFDTQTNDVTPVTIVSAPDSTSQRKIMEILVYNADTVMIM